ncbi:MAG: rod shape-determining protein [Firmicutes bacterium]|nr:rod shape-determining protein [Bacillota bacterium]
MPTIEIAVEIGTSNTSIFVSGNGIALREPTIAAYVGGGRPKKLICAGLEAYAMLGKTPERTQLVTPVTDGVISNPDVCAAILKEFFKKVLPDAYFPPRVKAIVGIPTGLSVAERRMYEDVVFDASPRVKEVTLVENIILSAVGIDLPIASAAGGLVANLGGGTTEIAALSFSGVISGCGLNIGGDAMDAAILDGIAGKHNLKVGLATARKLKEEVASLYENDMSARPVNGLDLSTRGVGSALITAADLYEVLAPYYARVGAAVESILNMCPPDVAGDISRKGIYLVGGTSRIAGAAQFLAQQIGIAVHVPEDPEYAAILGAGKLLSDKKLLEAIFEHK